MTPGKVRELLNGCSLPAAVELVGERWAFLILAAALNGVRHFEQFQAELGIARNILASRLGRLVENGILLREPVAENRRKVVYRLTAKGEALLPAMIALMPGVKLTWQTVWIPILNIALATKEIVAGTINHLQYAAIVVSLVVLAVIALLASLRQFSNEKNILK